MIRGKKGVSFVPDEVRSWYEKGFIDRDQYDRIRALYSGDMPDAVEFFRGMDIISHEQSRRIRSRYLPDEIDSWYEQGLITEEQQRVLRRGYEADLDRMIALFFEEELIDEDQLLKIEGYYSERGEPHPRGATPAVPAPPVGVGFQPPSPLRQKGVEVGIDAPIEERWELPVEPLRKVPGEGMLEEEWEVPLKEPVSVEGPPSGEVRPKREPVSVEGPPSGKVRPGREPPKGASFEGPDEEPVHEEEKASFFRFNQLIFFIAFGVIFILGMLALIQMTWDMMDDVDRGFVFLGISVVMGGAGFILHIRGMNRYLEVVTYHSSLILFAIGVVFLLVGTMDQEDFQDLVVMVSLLIPLSVMFLAVRYRYLSIGIVSFLGFLFAIGNSMFMWSEGGAIACVISLLMFTYFHFTEGRRPKDERAPKGDIFMRSVHAPLVLFSLITFVMLGCWLSQADYNAADALNRTFFVFSVLLPLIFIVYGLRLGPNYLMAASYLLLIMNIEVQFERFMDWGFGTANTTVFAISLAAILLGLEFLRHRRKEPARVRYITFVVLGCIFLVPSLLLMDLLWDGTDLHTQRFALSAAASILITAQGSRKRVPGAALVGFSLLMVSSLYHGIARFEPTIFILAAGPLLFPLLFRKWRNHPGFRVLMLVLLFIGYCGLWAGPVLPYGWMEGLVEPVLDWWKGGITILFGLLCTLWGLRRGWREYIVLGIVFYCFSTLMAMMGEGDAFVFLLFILTLLPFLFRRFALYDKGKGLSDKEESIYINSFSLVMPIFFIAMWLVPVFSPVEGSGIERFVWKYMVTMAFGTLFMLWGVLSRRMLLFIEGSYYYSASTLYFTAHKGEVFALMVLLLPALAYLLERFRGFGGKGKEKVMDYDTFHILYLLPIAVGFLMMLFLTPLNPVFAVSRNWNTLVWYKTALSIPFLTTLLFWGLFRRSPPHYLLGSFILASVALMLSIVKCDAFALCIFVLPPLLWFVEKRGEGSSYLPYLDSLVSRFLGASEKTEKPVHPSSVVFYDLFSKVFVLIGLISTLGILIGPSHPLIPASSLGGVDWVYRKSFLLFLFSTVFLIWGYMRDERTHQVFGTFLFTGAVLYLGILRLELSAFCLFLIPLISYGIGALRGKTEEKDSLDSVVDVLFLLPLFIGFVLLLIRPVEPVVDIERLSRPYWFYKTGITMLYSMVILIWGSLSCKKAHYVFASLLYSISVLTLSLSLLSPFVFMLLLLPLISRLLARFGRTMGAEVIPDRFFRGFSYMYTVVLLLGFIGLLTIPYDPLIRIDTHSQAFWLYRSGLVITYSSCLLAWSLFRGDMAYHIYGCLLFVLSLLIASLTVFEPSILLLLLLPLVLNVLIKRSEDRIDGKGPYPRIWWGAFTLVMVGGFFLTFVPAAYPVAGLKAWTFPFYFFHTFIALLYLLFTGVWSVVRDSPLLYLLSAFFLVVTSFVMSFTFLEPAAFLIFLIPISLKVMGEVGLPERFRGWAASVWNAVVPKEKMDPSEGDPYRLTRTPFLLLAYLYFLFLFVLVWNRPHDGMFDLGDEGRLWYMCLLLFIYSAIILSWGLSGLLRAHVLSGVLFIVIDGWILFLNQLEDWGAVLALFFTAFMFLLAGVYFVYATKRIREKRA